MYEQELVTATNKRPLLVISTWLPIIVGFLAVITRLLTKYFTAGKLTLDDFLAILSTALAIVQSGLVLGQCSAGLGRQLDSLQDGQPIRILKLEYAAALFFIVSLLVAKLSLIETIKNMARRKYSHFILALQAVTGLWAVSGLFVVLFQCGLPSPWDYTRGHCIHLVGFWTYFSITNIVTDLATIVLIVDMIRDIQTTRSKKAVVIGVFSSRAFMIPAIACQIYYTRAPTSTNITTSNFTFDRWQATIAVQVVQCLSLITICVPFLKPFLDSLESGGMRFDYLHRSGNTGTSAYLSDQSNSRLAESRRPNESRALGSIKTLHSTHSRPGGKWHELVDLSERPGARGGAASHHSDASNRMLIHQTKTWNVQVENSDEVRATEPPKTHQELY